MAIIKIYASQIYRFYSDGFVGYNPGNLQLNSEIWRCAAEFNPIDYIGDLDLVVKTKSRYSSFNMNVGYFNTKAVYGVTTKDSPITLIKTINTSLMVVGSEFTITGIPKIARDNGIVFWDANKTGIIHMEEAATTYFAKEFADATTSNLTIYNTDVDVNTIVSWDSTNQSVYELQALQGGIVVYSTSGNTAKNKTIPYNTFAPSTTTFRVRVGTGITGYILWSDWAETTATFTKKIPSIATLEPDSVNQNLNLPIVVSWASTNQSAFKLTVDSNVYTGTTATSLTIPSSTLTSGTKTMTLEVTYIPLWATSTADHRKVIKTVNFLAYGNPPTPTLLNKAIINTATPLIKWDSTEQVAYEFKLLDGMSNVVVTGEVLSAVKQYQVAVALENNKIYNLKLRVKNQYGLWSEHAVSTFTTSFVVPNTPAISGFANISNGSIVLNVATETSTEYKNTEIWRKEPYGEWVRMAYNLAELDTWVDNYVKGNTAYEYKARSIGQTGGIAESDSILLSTTVKGYNFYNLENLGSNITFKYDADVVPTFNRNEALTMYAGCNAPSYETDNVIYQTLNMSFTTKTPGDIDKFVNLIKTTKVFLYKDLKGRKVFGMITGNFAPKTDNSNITTISFSFTELSFLEQDVYAGANTGLKLLMWDGTWMFDGTYAFGGAQ